MKSNIYSIFTTLLLLSCNTLNNDNKKHKEMAKNIKIAKSDSISKIFDHLNWWMNESYNVGTQEVESTGEAQAAIKDYLYQLDELKIKYKLEGKKYIMVEK